MQAAAALGVRVLEVQGDSELIVRQVTGRWVKPCRGWFQARGLHRGQGLQQGTCIERRTKPQ